MPYPHVVAIRLPLRGSTVASWAFIGRQRPPKAAGPRPQPVLLHGRRPTAHSPSPVVTTRQRISFVIQQLDLDNTRGPARPTLQTFHQIRAHLPIQPGCGERAARKSALGRPLVSHPSTAAPCLETPFPSRLLGRPPWTTAGSRRWR